MTARFASGVLAIPSRDECAIPFLDLGALHREFREEIDDAVRRVVEASSFIRGPEVDAFEREFAAYLGCRHAVGVGNGTDALALSLRALRVGPGDEVVTVPFSFAATVEAICHVGARPRLADIDPDTFAMDPPALRRALAEADGRAKAVIPVHLYGLPAPMDEIRAAAEASGAAVIEDAAQAHGAEYRGARAGSLGALACFSFYPAKNLGALGDGGAVTTNDDALAAAVRSLRDHGQRRKYEHERIGFNSRLDGLQAAVLRAKLRRLDEWNGKRRKVAEVYGRGLEGLDGIRLPAEPEGLRHAWHLYTIRCERRDDLRSFLEGRGIGTAVHYPLPLHLQPAFAFLGYRPGDFPNSERCSKEVLCLPMGPHLEPKQASLVVEAVRAWAAGARAR